MVHLSFAYVNALMSTVPYFAYSSETVTRIQRGLFVEWEYGSCSQPKNNERVWTCPKLVATSLHAQQLYAAGKLSSIVPSERELILLCFGCT